MRRLRAQWCVQMNGFTFGTCVLSYQSHPYKEGALIPVTMERWCGYETVVCTCITSIFSEASVQVSSRNDAPLRIAQDVWNRFLNWSRLLVTNTAVCLEKTEKFCLIALTCEANFLIARYLDTRWVPKQRWEERFQYKKRVSMSVQRLGKHPLLLSHTYIPRWSPGVIIPLQEQVCINSLFNLVSKAMRVTLVWLFFALWLVHKICATISANQL